MKARGSIISVDKEFAQVLIGHDKDACKGCGACGGKRQIKVTTRNDMQGKVGDCVTLEISDQKYTNSVFLLFVLPLLGLILGVLAGYFAAEALGLKSFDIIAVLCGIITATLVYVVIWLFRKKIDSKPTAYIISIDKE